MADQFSELTTLGFVKHVGDVQPAGFVKRDIVRSGVIGKASMITGYIGTPFQMATTAVAEDGTEAGLLQILYALYKCHLVTFTDDHGNVWTNLSVEDVTDIRIIPISSGVGLATGCTRVVTANWTLQAVA